MVYSHSDIIQKILDSKKQFIIFGLSCTTKEILEKNKNIIPKIFCIIDNNKSLNNTAHHTIPIYHSEVLRKYKQYTILVWGNHTIVIVAQLNKMNITDILISFEYSKQNILSKNFKFTLEVPNKTSNLNDANHTFSRNILNALLVYYRPICTKPIQFETKYHLARRNPKKNNLIISYHSAGIENPHILRWKEGYLPDMITFDAKGYSGWSSLCDINILNLLSTIPQDIANIFYETLKNKYITHNISKYKQPKDNAQTLILPNDFIFFPLQTLNDSVTKHSYFKPLTLLKTIANLLHKNNIPLVVKKHPRCNNIKLATTLETLKTQNKIILFNGSIHEAITKAKCIYTVNSGVGFESLMHLKPVVTFGKSDYMDFTLNIKDLKILAQNNYFFTPNNDFTNNIKKFLYYYINSKCININNQKELQKILDHFILRYLQMNTTKKGN